MPSARSLLQILSLVAVAVPCAGVATGDDFEATIRPLFATYCFKCHGAEDEKRGDVDLMEMNSDEQIDAGFEIWETAIELIAEGAMPPQDQPQPTKAEKATLSAWYQDRFVSAVTAHPGFFRPRRLSAHEYRNTLHSLLGFPLEVAIIEAEQTVAEKSLVMKLLPTDPPGASGFTNDTAASPLSAVLWDQYSYLTDNGLEKLFSRQHRQALERYTGPIEGNHVSAAQAEQLLRRFRERAYRRDLPGQAVEQSLAAIRGKDGAELEAAARMELKAILMSPAFLFRGFLLDVPRDVETPVDQFELAERLSYFLWADMPDGELLHAARHGRLSDPNVYREQIDRMLASPKARNLAEDFGVQWFSLNEIELVSDNPPVADALKSQVVDFLHYLFTEGRPLIELVDSRTAFVNPHTSKFYPRDRGQMVRYQKQKGIEVEIVPNQRISLENTPERGGLLTMPGVLAMNKGPVLRGTWVLERILGEELPEPPADVGQVPGNRSGESLTFRQRFELHRSNETCAVCHDRIDPLGFALEEYDGGGRYIQTTVAIGSEQGTSRATRNSIDSSGRMPSGESFEDFAGLREILVTTERKRVIRNIVERMMSYALCRRLRLHDRPTIDAIVEELHETNGTFHDLIHRIAHSLPFRATVVRSR